MNQSTPNNRTTRAFMPKNYIDLTTTKCNTATTSSAISITPKQKRNSKSFNSIETSEFLYIENSSKFLL